MRTSLTVPGLVAAAVLLPGTLPTVALAGPETATNPTTRQPESANTPTQASKDSDDSQVTQQIRSALRADTSLSPEAKRIDVRTNTDVVILRGAVSAAEKDKIERVAGQFAGTRSVTSQLLVRAAE